MRAQVGEGDSSGAHGACAAANSAGTVEQLVHGLSSSIGAARVERDFFNGSVFRVDGDTVVVRVSSTAAADVLKSRYAQVLEEATKRVGLASVRFAVEPTAVPTALKSTPAAEQRTSKPRAQLVRRSSLNELVPGPGNRLALDAARRVASGSLRGCLVYLHGGCGLGKTHILSAVADEAGSSTPASVRVVSGEQFANEFIAAVKAERSDRMERFRKQYRSLDVLCVDDLQSLRGKTGTQNELQHTIDAVLARGGRVLLCGSCNPRRMEHLTEQLVSRLMGGLVVEIAAPDTANAARIVQALAARRGLVIEGPAAEALAGAVAGDSRSPMREVSVRDLEGLVTKVEAVHRLLGAGSVQGDTNAGGAVGMLSVNRALADSNRSVGQGARVAEAPGGVLARIGPRQPVRLEEVVALVCQRLSVTMGEVAGRGRHPRVVLARAAATLLARRHTRASYPEIARALGRPNHSTVITAHQRLETLLQQGHAADMGDGRGERSVSEFLGECSAALGFPAQALGQTQTA
ncbi:MAG: DnaA/Hda family protein [Phycisphaerales bacterium]